jgi:hypothetical protein
MVKISMRKSLAIFILATLLLPMLTFAAPVSASTGHPAIGTYNGSGNFIIATTSVNVTAGDMIVEAIDGASAPFVGYLTIVFAINSTLLVDFSGAQFDLYMSKNGYSNLTADDVLYASGFSVSDLSLAYGLATGISTYRMGSMDDFYIGTVTNTTAEGTTSYKVLSGPIPFDITNDYQFIKIFDGSATLIAAAGVVNVQPALDITPDYGPACAEVTISGVALSADTLYNITYQNGSLIGQAYTDSQGTFTFTWNMIDLMNDHCMDGGYALVTIDVVVASTGAFVGTLYFGELSRELWGIWVAGNTADYPDFGNGTREGVGCINAHIFDTLHIEGDHWCPTSDVVIAIDGSVIGTFSANGTGYFNGTGMTIPVLTMGPHTLTVSQGNFFYQYCLNINPTLLVIPASGPCGTLMEFEAYGFPEGNVYLYWYGICYDEPVLVWFSNATVGSDGQFNVSVTYEVPATYGGVHTIYAYDSYYGTSMGSDSLEPISTADFTVTPSLWVLPDPVDMDGSLFTVYGCGFDPTIGYYPDTSASEFNPYTVYCDCCGQLQVDIVAAGLRPGLHSFALYAWGLPCSEGGDGVYTPVAYTTFAVSTEGDLIAEQLASISALLVSINGTTATVSSDIGALQLDVATINAQITALSGDVATITTDIGTLTTSLASIGATVTSINNGVATIQTTLGTVNTNVASIKGFLPVDMTPVWIAVVLSLVAAIAAIYSIVVIRGKIAA